MSDEMEMDCAGDEPMTEPDNNTEPVDDEEETETETSPFDSGKLCETPPGAPMSFLYENDNFYIRECYPEYYNLLMELLKKKHYITVTGTPGIGKSIFYLYFLTRYRKENPGKNVVTASFSMKQKLQQCVLFKDDGEVVEQDDIPRPKTLVRKDGLDCKLYLYDGPPEVTLYGVKMIAFSSPHIGWLNSMRKESFHIAIYMPSWTFQELERANVLLGLMPSWTLEELERANNLLGFNVANLYDRFSFFGGCARYCLTTDLHVLKKGYAAINQALRDLNDFSQVKRLFDEAEESNIIIHRLMNYIPDEEDKTEFSLKPASLAIKDSLRIRMLKILSGNRKELMATLEGCKPGSTLAGWLFEAFAHDTLAEGGTFNIYSLDTDDVVGSVVVGCRHAQFPTQFTLEEIHNHVYYVPESPSYRSIDSFIMTQEGRLLLFQMTLSNRHPIKAKGLIDTMTRLQILDKIRAKPQLATVIFVVPRKKGFHKQTIDDVDTRSYEQVQDQKVSVVTGIGDDIEKKLNDVGINTIGKLKAALDSNKKLPSRVKTSAHKYFAELDSNYKFLKSIPQFVLELPYATNTDTATGTTTTTATGTAPPTDTAIGTTTTTAHPS